MVTVDLPSTSYYAGLLTALYAALEAVDCTDFAWLDSDGFHRARAPSTDGTPHRHLETWVDLGSVEEVGRDHRTHGSALVFSCRYMPDDDTISQARMHAATETVMSVLDQFRHHNARTRPRSADISALSNEWLAVTVYFYTQIPRTRR